MMKIKVIILGCVFACLFVVESCKGTQQNKQGQNRGGGKGKPTTEMLLKKMDADGDGLLSVKEAKGPLSNDFEKIDTNSDGFLSEKELENLPEREDSEGARGRGGR